LNDRATCSTFICHQSPAPDLDWAKDLPMGDWPLQAALAAHGPWFLMNEVMGTYRKHRTSVWSSGGDERAMRGELSFYDAAIKEFGLRAREAVSGRRKDLLAVLLYCALRRGDWAEARSFLATLSWQDRLTTIAYSGIRAVTRCLKRYGQATSPVSAPQFRTG
jgi:hypothetical protein